MSDRPINEQVLDLATLNTSAEDTRRQLVSLIAGVRIDDLPESDRQRIAGEGNCYPLVVDKDGRLRVIMADGVKVETQELEVLRDNNRLLIEIRDLLMKIA